MPERTPTKPEVRLSPTALRCVSAASRALRNDPQRTGDFVGLFYVLIPGTTDAVCRNPHSSQQSEAASRRGADVRSASIRRRRTVHLTGCTALPVTSQTVAPGRSEEPRGTSDRSLAWSAVLTSRNSATIAQVCYNPRVSTVCRNCPSRPKTIRNTSDRSPAWSALFRPPLTDVS
jgi:hypothetical protein